jgi:flagellar biosynthesis protein FlhA
VIQGFAQFVMGGSVFLGLVTFGVLLIVNFMVINKGAARMAEVGARFALDGMPGKQMAIDADMAAGAIDHATAKARRENDQKETTFFGSLDGASKFVKGDAIAGLLITLLNLVMGLVMGVLVHGMQVSAAFETYAILTVGDGLVSQIPSVIISIAAALLLARGGATGATDIALMDQFGKHPAALTTVAVLMVLFALVPGLPFLPFLFGGAVLAFAAYRIQKKIKAEEEAEIEEEMEETANPAPAKALGDILDLDDLHLEFAPDLVSMVLDAGTGLDARIANMRTHIATSFGLILPEIRLTDQAELERGTYVVKVQGVEQVRGTLHPDMVLALMPDNHGALPPGTDVTEPVYGAPARWINAGQQEDAALAGATVVTPPEILATHLLEVIKQNFARLLTFKSLRRLLNEMTELSDQFRAEANRKLLDDLVPDKVPLDTLHAVLRLLLDERVSIRNLPLILEAIAEARIHSTQPEVICEHVRQRLGFQLVAEMKREDGTIPLIQLAPEWEDTFSTYQVDVSAGNLDVALPPDMFNRLAEGLSERLTTVTEQGVFAAVVTSTRRRRYLRTILKSRGITNPVLSFEEIGLEARPALVGMVAA